MHKMLISNHRSLRAFVALVASHHSFAFVPSAPCLHAPHSGTATVGSVAGAISNNRLPQQFSPSKMTLHASAAGSGQSDENMKLVELQKKKSAESSSAKSAKPINSDSLSEHLAHQRDTFDSMADFFDSEEATPDDVRPILQSLVGRSLARMLECQDSAGPSPKGDGDDDNDASANESNEYHILDVGCGVGALFPYYVEAADAMDIRLKVTGVDLSPQMTALAKSNADDLVAVEQEEEEGGGEATLPRHTFDVATGDFVEMVLGINYYDLNDGAGYENEDTNQYRSMYDAVVVNACYGNFYDEDALLAACAQSLKPNGVACITHPLGAGFVHKLHEESPDTVPNALPHSHDAFDTLCFTQALNPIEFVEGIGAGEGQDGGYFACAKRTPHKALSKILNFRGTVATGYGRGGKKLGFPTANLPSSLFTEALADVRAGVYFGWAVIESPEDGSDSGVGCNIPHKAVVNVGYSPTFEGKENAEKIIEAHLCPEGELSDFYGQKMSMILGGFLRPERKFPSFPDLIAAINNDVTCAKRALDLEPFAGLKTEEFVAGAGTINSSDDSGDQEDEASWGTQDW